MGEQKEIEELLSYAAHNKKIIADSRVAGCFCCLKAFPAKDVCEYSEDGDTALCPKCGIDSVVGDATGYEITPDALRDLRELWFF